MTQLLARVCAPGQAGEPVGAEMLPAQGGPCQDTARLTAGSCPCSPLPIARPGQRLCEGSRLGFVEGKQDQADLLPPCPHGNRCGMLQRGAGAAPAQEAGAAPSPAQEPLSRRWAKAHLHLCWESETLLFRGKWKCNQISLYSASRKSVLIKPEEMQSSRSRWKWC